MLLTSIPAPCPWFSHCSSNNASCPWLSY
jgi:hypothetical protein